MSQLTVAFILLLPSLASGAATFVQVNSNTSARYTNSVAVAFTNPQAAGNLNVVVVGWSGTSIPIAGVTDSNGNTYALAAGTMSTPVPAPGAPGQTGVSQAIYYAKNINAGANTVTVTFNQNTINQSVRVVEYSGLDATNPLDTSVGTSGNSTAADSGAATTNSAHDLIFGAGTTTSGFTASGSGFTTRQLNSFNDIVEDKVVATAGSNNATATLTSGGWVMQMVAFREAGEAAPTFAAPAITSLSAPSSPEAGGLALTITGTDFQPGATVLFSTSTVTGSGVNCTVTLLVAPNATINCLTPSLRAGLAGITVTNVDGQTSAEFAFAFTASTPFATAVSPSITPSTGPNNGGTLATISGSDFAAGAKLTLGGVLADRISVINVNTILADLPAGAAGLATVIVTNPSGTAGTSPAGYTYAAGPGINFVQANSVQPASPATTAIVPYTLAQTAGNLNVVIVGWGDTAATVQSVTDTAGNTYTLALPPTLGTGLSQATYYAKNINAAATNTVTVTFSAAALFPDVHVLEYSGLDTAAPLDTAGGAAGTGTTVDTGPITTHNPADLIIGAATVGGLVTAADPGFTTVAITPVGDSVEHLVGFPAGVINATAKQNSNSPWVIQAVAFQLSGTAPDFTISVTPPSTATVTPGGSATYTISVSGLNGFTTAVTLSCPTGLPAGASCAFVPPSVTPGGAPVTSTLTITTTAATPAGNSTVTVTGTAGSVTHNTTVTLTTQDFTLSATTLSPATVATGVSATSTITIAPLNGFNGTVNLSCSSITPVVTPAAVCAFVPPSVTGSGTSTLTVSTTGTPVGNYVVTVAGTVGSLTHSHTLALAVQAAPTADFTITGTPLSPAAVTAGGSATSTITIAPLNGFTDTVNLTCSIAPVVSPAPTCTLVPTSVTGGSGTSTLTIRTTATTTSSLMPQTKGALFAIWLPIGGLALIGAGFKSRKNISCKKKILSFLLGCLLFSGLIFLAACGGSSSSGGGGTVHPGTPSGAYTITVTGTSASGSLTHPATPPLSLAVN